MPRHRRTPHRSYDTAHVQRIALLVVVFTAAGPDALACAEHTSGLGTPPQTPEPQATPKVVRKTQEWTSDEDKQLAQLVSEGKTNKDIASELGRTERAVRMRRQEQGLGSAKRKLELTEE